MKLSTVQVPLLTIHWIPCFLVLEKKIKRKETVNLDIAYFDCQFSKRHKIPADL